MAEQTLEVLLNSVNVGLLTQDRHGLVNFSYLPTWLANPRAVSLSHSLPLQSEPFKRNQWRPFFAGVLPEESQRNLIANNLNISASNDFAMLKAIAGDCAGAVSLQQSHAAAAMPDISCNPLTPADHAQILMRLPAHPLLAGEEGIRLSLAGAQNKMALHRKNGLYYRPVESAVSTHIIKPDSPHFPGLIYNEAWCMQAASAVGLPVAHAEVCEVEEIPYLVIERYDRVLVQEDTGATVARCHQEDFCQALGVIPEHKYQNEGGPSLTDCFGLVHNASSMTVKDFAALLDAVLFNFLIGNNDAHGKNFSLLYQDSGSRRITSFAPCYDLICTCIYPELSTKMAMKIGNEYESKRVYLRHFEQMAASAQLSPSLVKKRLQALAISVLHHAERPQEALPAQQAADFTAARCREVLGWY